MESVIFGESVQGASHKRTDPPTPCQDFCIRTNDTVLPDGTIILAVADGHGSKECIYSRLGSRYAVKAFCEVIKDYNEDCLNQPDKFFNFLKHEGDTTVAQKIERLWKKLVLTAHRKSSRDIPEADDIEGINAKIYRQYGSTLLGLVITPTFLFAYQLGDGDITYIDGDCTPGAVLAGDKFLGTETHSLSSKDSWKQAVTCVRRRDSIMTLPHMFLLSTDGFANSHKNEEEYHKTCIDYFKMINEHGCDAVKSNLNKWLDETSTQGCGDDITLLLAYFYDSSGEAPKNEVVENE